MENKLPAWLVLLAMLFLFPNCVTRRTICGTWTSGWDTIDFKADSTFREWSNGRDIDSGMWYLAKGNVYFKYDNGSDSGYRNLASVFNNILGLKMLRESQPRTKPTFYHKLKQQTTKAP